MSARAFLTALRAAGCHVYLDEDLDVIVSPPSVPIAWPDDPEHAIETHSTGLRELLEIELIVAAFGEALRRPL